MSVTFDGIQVGEQYFFPGQNRVGEIKQFFGKRKRREVRVLFSGGVDVVFNAKTFFAVPVNEAAKYRKAHGAGPQLVGLNKIKGDVVDVPRGQTKWLRPKRPNRMLKAGSPSTKDTRNAPDIPGPPVPKPKHGVWSDTDWSIT